MTAPKIRSPISAGSARWQTLRLPRLGLAEVMIAVAIVACYLQFWSLAILGFLTYFIYPIFWILWVVNGGIEGDRPTTVSVGHAIRSLVLFN